MKDRVNRGHGRERKERAWETEGGKGMVDIKKGNGMAERGIEGNGR